MESIVVDSYRSLTTEIALGLSAENTRIIKFLLRNDIGKGVLEKIVTGTDLVQLLEENAYCQPTTLNNWNLSNHDYYRLHGMHVIEQYIETSEYRQLCQHMKANNAVILKGLPGTWKSRHAFRYAHEFSKLREKDNNSLIWRIDCNTELNIYNSLSHLMNFLKIQCINSELQIKDTINIMLLRAVAVLENDNYKDTRHLFILLGFISPQKILIKTFLETLNQYDNISIIVATSESLSNDFDNIVLELHGMTEDEAVNYLEVDDSVQEKAKELAKN
ncbi:unnamed protein product [Mytilus edulis]|uniref:DED domain-containing protein n=1 Tax=Mytilus edulis TaxID=6550 RepID=A0A8S3R7I9_MYTED|nr:unnamed protein product [Mytilus edulis]